MIVHDAPQGSEAWLRARLGLPTASMAANLVTPAGNPSEAGMISYARKIAFQRHRGALVDEFGGNDVTERGHFLEPIARRAYAARPGVEVVEVGFATDGRAIYGASFDSLVNDDGILEIKCPQASAYMKALMAIEDTGSPPIDYLPQAHMQMLVADRLWCDLTFFHPDAADDPADALAVVRIERSEEWDRKLLAQIALCTAERDRALAVLRRRAGFAEAA